MTAQPLNPFEPPVASGRVASSLPLLPEHRWGELKIEVSNVVRGWNRRRMILTGSINAQILYDPNGHGERVYVNDELVATTSVMGFRLVQPRANSSSKPLSISSPRASM